MQLHCISTLMCFQDYVDRKLVVTVRSGECTAAGGGSGATGLGCLIEMTVTALRTTVVITDTGEFAAEDSCLYTVKS